MLATRAGYCGGSAADPTYGKVCKDGDFSNYAEAIQVTFNPAQLSYKSLIDIFYFAYDGAVRFPRTPSAAPLRRATTPVACRPALPKRQYAPVIFAHDSAQRAAAEFAVADATRRYGQIATVVEEVYQDSGRAFWDAEPYHQKWKLQRRRELMLALELTDTDGLFSRAATALNAFAGGALSADDTRQRLRALVHDGELTEDVYDAVAKLLESKPASAPGAWRR